MTASFSQLGLGKVRKALSVEEQKRVSKIPFREDLHVLKTPIVANVAEAGCATRS